MKFASGTELKLHLDGDRGPGLGAIFIGEKGKIEINRNKLASNPKEMVRVAKTTPAPTAAPRRPITSKTGSSASRAASRATPTSRSASGPSSLCYLVNIVRDVGRVGQPLKWDPVAERFTNCDEANKLLERPRRKGYELPDVG